MLPPKFLFRAVLLLLSLSLLCASAPLPTSLEERGNEVSTQKKKHWDALSARERCTEQGASLAASFSQLKDNALFWNSKSVNLDIVVPFAKKHGKKQLQDVWPIEPRAGMMEACKSAASRGYWEMSRARRAGISRTS
jgi:hypothetical protein